MSAVIPRSVVENLVRQAVLQRLSVASRPPVPGGQMGRPTSEAGRPKLVVNVSSRHMHVTREDFETLFGKEARLTVLRPLYQEGHFASEQSVTLVGPKSRLISNLRILGPFREYTQIELSYTDAITLGIENVPPRLSGNLDGTPGAYVMGPAAMLEMKKGVIRAAPHAHMSPADAETYGVKNGDLMRLRVTGEITVDFHRVNVRVSPTSRLEVHLDTDEANACGLHAAREVELLK